MSNSKFLDRVAFYLANESGRDAEVILFGMRLFFTSASGYVALIILASLLGILPHALAAAITASVFRIFFGGAHASSPLRCNLIGVGVFLTLGFISNLFPYVQSLIYLPVIIAYYWYIRHIPICSCRNPWKAGFLASAKKILESHFLFFVKSLEWHKFLGIKFTRWIFRNQDGSSKLFWYGMELFTLTPFGFKVVGGMDSMFKFSMERRG